VLALAEEASLGTITPRPHIPQSHQRQSPHERHLFLFRTPKARVDEGRWINEWFAGFNVEQPRALDRLLMRVIKQ
jgi:hypothetical protein